MRGCYGLHNDKLLWPTPCQFAIAHAIITLVRIHYSKYIVQESTSITRSINQKIQLLSTCITYKLMFDDIDSIQQIHEHVHVKERKETFHLSKGMNQQKKTIHVHYRYIAFRKF